MHVLFGYYALEPDVRTLLCVIRTARDCGNYYVTLEADLVFSVLCDYTVVAAA